METNTIVMICVLILLFILIIVSGILAPKLKHRCAIQGLILLKQYEKSEDIFIEFPNTIRKAIDALSELHDIQVKKSKRGKGWFVTGTRTFYIGFADGTQSLVINQEYFPTVCKDGENLPTTKGRLHAPDQYFTNKEAAERHKEYLMHEILNELMVKYKDEIDAKTVWED